ncbi:F-box only protein 39-like [Tubulanus polymorphus]|uniref:F-box only protein 39-like n=1 Tax=Tubulanus polymorphus TaxID=672921 RepID=UPI003DA3453B
MEIVCRTPTYLTCKRVQQCLTTFFGTLYGKVKLKRFQAKELQVEKFWRYDLTRSKLIVSLNRFLRGQKSLRYFDMRSSTFIISDGIKILESIGYHSGHSLTHLNITDFFHSRLTIFRISKFNDTMKHFKNLQHISMNYNCLSESVLETLANNCSCLSTMEIKVHRNDPHDHRLTGAAWKNLTKCCPEFMVQFDFASTCKYHMLTGILVPEIPLTELQIRSGFESEDEWHIPQSIHHISDSFSDSLENLKLDIDNSDQLFDMALLDLVSKCRKLKNLVVDATFCIPTIEEICQLQEDGKINLKKFYATCCSATEIDWAELLYVETRYKPMLNNQGVDFRFSTDMIVDPISYSIE